MDPAFNGYFPYGRFLNEDRPKTPLREDEARFNPSSLRELGRQVDEAWGKTNAFGAALGGPVVPGAAKQFGLAQKLKAYDDVMRENSIPGSIRP